MTLFTPTCPSPHDGALALKRLVPSFIFLNVCVHEVEFYISSRKTLSISLVNCLCLFSNRCAPPQNRGPISPICPNFVPRFVGFLALLIFDSTSVHLCYFLCGQAVCTSMACHVCGCRHSSLQAEMLHLLLGFK